MIHALTANDPRFHSITFRRGLNLILADTTEQSGEQDSRNGLGKTSLLHLVHFCLGGDLPDHLETPELETLRCTLDIDVADRRHTFSRSCGDPGTTTVSGATLERLADADGAIRVEDLNIALGEAWFGLTAADRGKYAPSFRALISYFARRRHDAYVSPLKHFHSQPGYQQQVLHAFLLGLDWRYPQRQRLLYEERQAIRALRRATEDGPLADVIESAGELRARRVQIERRLTRLQEQIEAFRVHPRYRELEADARQLENQIKTTVNVLTRDRRLFESYEESVRESEEAIGGVALEALYREAEVTLPALVKQSLDSVRAFHESLRNERLRYLESELETLNTSIEERAQALRRLEEQRSDVLHTLASHGALEDYRRLESAARRMEQERGEVTEQLRIRNRIDRGADEVRTRTAENAEHARQAFDESAESRDRVVELFDRNWEFLYGAGGRLVVDVTDSGYSFDFEVEREGSEGVGKMKIFAYDLALAAHWSERGAGPGFLFHDSTIWDGVDERQVAAGLQLAADVCDEAGLQYLTSLNTDMLPPRAVGDWEDSVVHRLTDASDAGRLFGFAF